MSNGITVSTATFATGVYAASWEDAVRAVGRDMVNAHSIGPAYIDEMVNIIDNYGPYCVIAPGVAVPHANARSVVRRDAIAVQVLTEPVRFGHPHNDPVSIVIGIAATTAKRHIGMIASLADTLDDASVVEAIANAQRRSDVIEALRVTLRS